MQGICKGCGQLQEVPAGTQEEADQKATAMCNCGEAEKIRKHAELMDVIDDICGEGGKEKGLDPVEPDTIQRIKEAATLVFRNKFEKATFSVEGSLITIKKSKDHVVVNRKMVIGIEGASRK